MQCSLIFWQSSAHSWDSLAENPEVDLLSKDQENCNSNMIWQKPPQRQVGGLQGCTWGLSPNHSWQILQHQMEQPLLRAHLGCPCAGSRTLPCLEPTPAAPGSLQLILGDFSSKRNFFPREMKYLNLPRASSLAFLLFFICIKKKQNKTSPPRTQNKSLLFLSFTAKEKPK